VSKLFKVGFDIDDVLLHCYPALHEVCVREGLTNGVEPTSWYPYDEYGCTREEWVAALDKAAREGYLYRDIAPDEDALRAMRDLYFDGHEIHLITSRGFLGEAEIIAEHTEGWLLEYGVPHKSLSYSQSKGLDAARLGLDYFIDDNERNFLEVRDNTPFTVSYLLDRPWNRHVEAGIFRVQSVREYADIIKEAANDD
jgi:uncharacterized HAD superfamily protein